MDGGLVSRCMRSSCKKDSPQVTYQGTTIEDDFHFDISHTPLWSAKAVVEAPDVIVQAHLAFMRSGADIVLTSTFVITLG